ncbi:hypothetical protein [Mucilaginibacter sp.]|uniref:hypothetical protein n=1 Tax=Mucilaginibacter sp. TaxID=1882438 RepID=UPI003267640A
MIAAIYNPRIYLRIATGMLLILLIGFKISAPVFLSLKIADKENTSVNESDSEKKTESNSPTEKEKEFTGATNYDALHLLWYTQVSHATGYQNNYKNTHFLKVTSPPPDLYIQPIC